MTVELVPTRVATAPDEEGRLVFVDERLVAVLVQLEALHGERAGRWFVEARFGTAPFPPEDLIFSDLEEVRAWFAGGGR